MSSLGQRNALSSRSREPAREIFCRAEPQKDTSTDLGPAVMGSQIPKYSMGILRRNMFSRESPAYHSGFLAIHSVVLPNFRFTEDSVSTITLSQAFSPAARSSAVPQKLFHTQAKTLVPLPTRQLEIFLLKKKKKKKKNATHL